MVATGGRWWVVWTSSPAPAVPSWTCPQAYTIGGTAHGREEHHQPPALGLGPEAGPDPRLTFPLTLVWVQQHQAGTETETDLRRALGNAGSTWSSSTLASLGVQQLLAETSRCGPPPNSPGSAIGGRFRRQPERAVREPPVQHAGHPRTARRMSHRRRGRARRLDGHRSTGRSGPPGRSGVWDGAFASPAGVPGSSSWLASRPAPARQRL